MKIAVVFLTCDRLDLTKKTVKSFLNKNDRSNFDLFYGDDQSTDDRIHSFMNRNSIKCIMTHGKRRGCSQSSDELLYRASNESNADYILYMQNDFESVRTIPLKVIAEIMDDHQNVGWIRLYGLNKNATVPGGNPTDPTNKFKPNKPMVEWTPSTIFGENIEIGDAQWSYHPAIHRWDILLHIIKGATRERDVGIAAVHTGLLTARFMDNITNHIGIRKTTPGGKFGKQFSTYGPL
jgi:hypothetical protein